MDLWEFIKKYYIDSIVYKQGYNIVNTATWAIILLVAVILIYRFLEKRIEINERFVYSNIPFVIFGSSLRVMEDAGFLSPPYSYLLMSPMIFFLIFGVAFSVFLISLKFKSNYYYRCYAAVGMILALFPIFTLFSRLNVVNAYVIPIGFLLASALTSVFYLLSTFINKAMINKLSLLAFFSHMLDASETYIGITKLGYWELHVLPRFLIENFGAESLVIAKFFVLLVVLYVVDKSEDNNAKNFIKFVLIVLGLAPGLRDGLRMSFGV